MADLYVYVEFNYQITVLLHIIHSIVAIQYVAVQSVCEHAASNETSSNLHVPTSIEAGLHLATSAVYGQRRLAQRDLHIFSTFAAVKESRY